MLAGVSVDAAGAIGGRRPGFQPCAVAADREREDRWLRSAGFRVGGLYRFAQRPMYGARICHRLPPWVLCSRVEHEVVAGAPVDDLGLGDLGAIHRAHYVRACQNEFAVAVGADEEPLEVVEGESREWRRPL